MAVTALRPLRIGEILDVAIKLYLRNFKTLVKVVAVLVVPLELVTVLIQISVIPEHLVTVTQQPFGQPAYHVNTGQLGAFIAGQVVIALLSFVLVVLATAASFKAVSDAYLGETPDWRGSLRYTVGRLGSLSWIALLSALLLIPAFLACVVPGIYLAIAWSVATPVLLTEGIKGRRALGRSRTLVKNRWWPTAGAFFVGYLFAAIVTGVFVAAATFFVVSDQSGSIVVHFFVQGIATTIARILTTPFQAAVVTIIYFDLRVRKEGFDLQLLAGSVGVEPSGAVPDLLPPPPPSQGGSQPPFWPPPPGWTPDPDPPPPPGGTAAAPPAPPGWTPDPDPSPGGTGTAPPAPPGPGEGP